MPATTITVWKTEQEVPKEVMNRFKDALGRQVHYGDTLIQFSNASQDSVLLKYPVQLISIQKYETNYVETYQAVLAALDENQLNYSTLTLKSHIILSDRDLQMI